MYWESLNKLVQRHKIIIDRRKGNAHPKYPEIIYPVDYGYLDKTTAIDGNGIDIFVGSLDSNIIQGIICTVDSLKNDTEIKIMYNCSENEIQSALALLNGKYISAIFMENSSNINYRR
ncbi:MAG: hypothetical protein KAR21_13980 [Spirochaetales bacterium]|nr:hypothetical protein [Spirochaetales bacterium]